MGDKGARVPPSLSAPRHRSPHTLPSMDPLITPDGRYLIVRGRLWRTTNPGLSEPQRATGPRADGRPACREVSKSQPGWGSTAAARRAVDSAKTGLGERGPVWWTDGEPDWNRHLVKNSPMQGGSTKPMVRRRPASCRMWLRPTSASCVRDAVTMARIKPIDFPVLLVECDTTGVMRDDPIIHIMCVLVEGTASVLLPCIPATRRWPDLPRKRRSRHGIPDERLKGEPRRGADPRSDRPSRLHCFKEPTVQRQKLHALVPECLRSVGSLSPQDSELALGAFPSWLAWRSCVVRWRTTAMEPSITCPSC